jgi:Predicted SAM-dependent RNA methyltransferase
MLLVGYCGASIFVQQQLQEFLRPHQINLTNQAYLMSSHIPTDSKTYVVEHLDPELEEWSSLEYTSIAKECHDIGSTFLLTSVQQDVILPLIQSNTSCKSDERSVEEIFKETKDRVCLLDPAAEKELSPKDGAHFSVFLFGGILGKHSLGIRRSNDTNVSLPGDDPPRGMWPL